MLFSLKCMLIIGFFWVGGWFRFMLVGRLMLVLSMFKISMLLCIVVCMV